MINTHYIYIFLNDGSRVIVLSCLGYVLVVFFLRTVTMIKAELGSGRYDKVALSPFGSAEYAPSYTQCEQKECKMRFVTRREMIPPPSQENKDEWDYVILAHGGDGMLCCFCFFVFFVLLFFSSVVCGVLKVFVVFGTQFSIFFYFVLTMW